MLLFLSILIIVMEDYIKQMSIEELSGDGEMISLSIFDDSFFNVINSLDIVKSKNLVCIFYHFNF